MSLKSKIKRALGVKTNYTAKPKLGKTRTPKEQQAWLDERKEKVSKRKVLKQYGDKGYQPSSGRGVGY